MLLTVVVSAGSDLRQHRNYETVQVRISAVAEPIHKSSFSPNRDAFFVELIGKQGSTGPVKLLFKYLEYEDGFPEDLVDYDLVHKFKAVRDRSCDETWHSFSTKSVAGSDGRWATSDAVRFTTTHSVEDISDSHLLPCYVAEARGYRGSKRIPMTERLAESNMEGR
jgi:hypothetical protein